MHENPPLFFFFFVYSLKKIILLSFIYTQGSILGWLTELLYKYGRFLFEVGLTFNLSEYPWMDQSLIFSMNQSKGHLDGLKYELDS